MSTDCKTPRLTGRYFLAPTSMDLGDLKTGNAKHNEAMTKKSPIKVFLKKTKHKGNQRFKVVIDDPGSGPLTELRERYTRKSSAKRGALRKLKAYQLIMSDKWFSAGREVIFIDETKAAKK